MKTERAKTARKKKPRWAESFVAGLPVLYGTNRNEEWVRQIKERLNCS